MKSSSVVLFPHQPALQLIYDTAPIGLACLSPDCRYLQINQRLTEICGISVEDHLGRTVRDCVPALAEAVEGIVRSIMNTGDPVSGIEVAGQRADQIDERFWVTYWHPYRNAAGDIVGVNVAAEEITERKRAEAALQASERQFHTLADSIPQLVWMADAEGKIFWFNNHWREYTGTDSHDWQAILAPGPFHKARDRWAQALETGTPLELELSLRGKDAQYRPFLTRAVPLRDTIGAVYGWIGTHIDIGERKRNEQKIRSARDAAELIQSFKQVATDRSHSSQRIFDLGDLTEQIAMSLRPGLRKQNLALNVECQPSLTMNSYPGPYGQVLTNLFLNSVAHGFPDGREGTVDIKVRASGNDDVEIIFSDDGCGMSLDVRRKAFDPFFTTRRDQGNTGLGLHIVYSVVTNCLGGRLALDSEPGKGTRIRLVLPRVAPAALAAL